MDTIKAMVGVAVRETLRTGLRAYIDRSRLMSAFIDVQSVPGQPLQSTVRLQQDGKPVRFFLISLTETT